MPYATIQKPKVTQFSVQPNLLNYAEAYRSFNWEKVRAELNGLPGGHLNITYECLSRHAQGALQNKIAMRWEGIDGKKEAYTFADLDRLTNRFANVLKSLGIKKGDRVFVFLDRIPELWIALFGILKCGAVAGPLFSAFGPDAIRDRMQDSEAKILVTSPELRKRVDEIKKELPALKHIIVVNKRREKIPPLPKNEVSYEKAMAQASDLFKIVPTAKEDYAIMHYTSGTTGKPKGAAHVHEAILGHYITAKQVLDLHPDDIYWCTADPGWVTGTSYGMFGPWSNGVMIIVSEAGFGADKWYSLIERNKVTVWYTAPTAIRMLMKAGDDAAQKYDLTSLRHIASVGEPLNPEAVVWGKKVYGLTIHDNYWQTETGCMQVANLPVLDVKPGSMGKPLPGVTVAILNEKCEPLPAKQEGHLALKPPWPSMFRTYWNKKELYDSRFKNGWYITGDKAWMDEDGYIWFVGRADDVINTAGHLVGPFEVESALIEHPAVAEAAVIGKPDPERMEIVKAFVSLKNGFKPSIELKDEIKEFVRHRLSAHAYPREIDFLDSLPKTRSGKIMRRLLKARELGLPEGDTSTLEE